MWGTDQAASLSPDGMKMFGSIFGKIEKIFGDGIKKFPEEEKNMLGMENTPEQNKKTLKETNWPISNRAKEIIVAYLDGVLMVRTFLLG